MPKYDYKCPVCGYTAEVDHPMIYSDLPVCDECGLSEMQRVYTMPAVNWGGLKPSQGEISPTIKRMIDDAPRRRDNETPHQSNTLARINEEVQQNGLS